MIKYGVSNDELLQEVLRKLKAGKITQKDAIKRLYNYGIDVSNAQLQEYLEDM